METTTMTLRHMTRTLLASAGLLLLAPPVAAQTPLLEVETSAGSEVATIRTDSMRLLVPLYVQNASSTGNALRAETDGSGAAIHGQNNGMGPALRLDKNASSTGRLVDFRYGNTTFGDIDPHGGLLLTGARDVGSIPAYGAGTRMMWYPGKHAFRAGTVDGTQWNDASVGHYSMATGLNTIASGSYTIAAGFGSTASDQYAVAFGWGSIASGPGSVAMGADTEASGNYAVALGLNTISSGGGSTALGGYTTASGHNSTALGYRASTNGHRGSFVYGDYSSSTDVTATGTNQFVVRAAGGTYFYSSANLSTGVRLLSGSGSWSSASDIALKENFRTLDGEVVLEKIARMPIREWNYRTQGAQIRHVGPTAQDFHSAFGLGENNTTISVVDADGVNMLAVQALENRSRGQQAEIVALQEENEELHDRVRRLEGLIKQLLESQNEGGAYR